MKFYHGTTQEGWEEIQKEGVLWGVRNAPSRCTYLASKIKDAKHFGEIILEIDYDPKEGDNNYIEGCWQHREYFPISLENVVVVAREHEENSN